MVSLSKKWRIGNEIEQQHVYHLVCHHMQTGRTAHILPFIQDSEFQTREKKKDGYVLNNSGLPIPLPKRYAGSPCCHGHALNRANSMFCTTQRATTKSLSFLTPGFLVSLAITRCCSCSFSSELILLLLSFLPLL